jgi:hypothetical protein
MVQAAVADPVVREGAISRGAWPQYILAAHTEGALAAGHLVQYGTDASIQVQEMAALPAADVDAIATAAVLVSAVTATDHASGTFDGVIGRDRMAPARSVTFTFAAANIADWDTPAGECRVDIYGTDALGASIKDTIARPNGVAGPVTYTTRKAFAQVTRIHTEASNGATGTATAGFSNDVVELSQIDYPGPAVYEPIKEPNTAAREFADNEDVGVLHRGRMWVVVEHAVSKGDHVYVRHTAAGADLAGQFAGMDGADTPTTYGKLRGARYMSAAAADGLAEVMLTGV